MSKSPASANVLMTAEEFAQRSHDELALPEILPGYSVAERRFFE